MRTLGTSLAVLMLFAVGFAAVTAQAQNLPSCPGTYSNQRNNCVGTHMYANGAKYVGGWRNGLMHGQGTFTWADGEHYAGEFRDDKYHGQGTITFADGGVLEGIFKDGEFQP